MYPGSGLEGVDDCSCGGGLSGVGLVDPGVSNPAADPCMGLSLVDFITCEARKITSGIVRPVPTLPTNLPSYPPTGYPVYGQYPTYGGTQPATNWTPYLIGGAVLLFLMSRR